jgi:membrane protease YdiL (CAAX protease family)
LTQQSYLYTDAGALRAPWRLLVFVVAAMASLLVVGGVFGPIITRIMAPLGTSRVSSDEWISAIAMLVATTFCVRVIDKRPWSDVWLGRENATPGVLFAGFAVGALAIAIPTGLLIVGGWLRDEPSAAGSWLAAMVRVSLMLVPAAFVEELMMRGYALSVLKDAWGWKWAIVATSILFGLLHIANAGATAGSIALVTLAGFFLAAVLYVTQSLYAAWIAHFAWNWTMAAVFHVAVSGIPVEAPNYRYVDAGPDWATGGEWGPEGGVPAALGMLAGMAVLFGNKQRRDAEAEERANTHRES